MKLTYNPNDDSILDIKPDRRTEVWNFGDDNSYPSLIETLIQNSVTAKSCIDKVSKAIYGKSFGLDGRKVINADGQTLNELLRIAAREYSTHGNLYIHVGYNGELKINSLKVLPNTQCRKGKSDDKGYSGKIIIYDNWAKDVGRRVEPSKFKAIDVFNTKETVLLAQIEAAGSISKFKGQVLHIQRNSNAVYSLSDLHPAMEDALLESKAQTFRRRGADKGFLNTKLMVVAPFSGEEEEQDFKYALAELQGAEASGGVLLLEANALSDGLDNAVKLEDLTTNYNDTMFSYSESQARQNICIALQVPLNLIDATDSGLFGNSGELLESMKTILWESQEEPRDMLEEVFNKLIDASTFDIPELKIITPLKENNGEPNNDNGV